MHLEPLFGESQFQPERRVAGPGWTKPEAPGELLPYWRIEGWDDLGEEELFDKRAEVADVLLETGVAESVFPVPCADLALRPPDSAREPVSAADAARTPTPDLRDRQGYLDDRGVNLWSVRHLPGATGSGVRIVDIEGAWCLEHEDLLQNARGVMAGQPLDSDRRMRNHGTAVMGVLGADTNEFGTTGICPDAIISALSVFGLRGGAAAAIRIAADSLARGDIVLVELHQPGPLHKFLTRGRDQDGYVPVEFFPDTFAAIRYATARGVIVVEAAGNGGQQLDDPFYDEVPAGFPPTWTNPFNPRVRNYAGSGAVLVGAGAPPGGGAAEPASSRMVFSNWGERVDAHGWGNGVATTGGYWTGEGDLAGGPDETRWYTSRFSGTSSAAPMVAGALACVQGVLRASGHTPLTPEQARRALRETGPEQASAEGRPATERIGRRPDIRALIDWALKETPRSETTRRRRRPMRVQITIDDGGDNDGVVVSSGDSANRERNGGAPWNPQWRGPFFLMSANEAAELGVPGAVEIVESGLAGNPREAGPQDTPEPEKD